MTTNYEAGAAARAKKAEGDRTYEAEKAVQLSDYFVAGATVTVRKKFYVNSKLLFIQVSANSTARILADTEETITYAFDGLVVTFKTGIGDGAFKFDYKLKNKAEVFRFIEVADQIGLKGKGV